MMARGFTPPRRVLFSTQKGAVSIQDVSPTYIHRLGKYFQRGIGVVVAMSSKVFDSYCHIVQKEEEEKEGIGEENVALETKLNSEVENARKHYTEDDKAKAFSAVLASIMETHDVYMKKKRQAYEKYDQFRVPDFPPGTADVEQKRKASRQGAQALLRQENYEAYRFYIDNTSIVGRLLFTLLKMCTKNGRSVFHTFNTQERLKSEIPFNYSQRWQERYIDNSLHQDPDYDDVRRIRQCLQTEDADTMPYEGIDDLISHQGIHDGRSRKAIDPLTSAGPRLLKAPIDKTYLEYLRRLEKFGKKPNLYVTSNLEHILWPEKSLWRGKFSSLKFSAFGCQEKKYQNQIPVDDHRLPLIAAYYENEKKSQMYVPEELYCPFVFQERDGLGSFVKKSPEDILQQNQWALRDVGKPVDEITRMLLGVESVLGVE